MRPPIRVQVASMILITAALLIVFGIFYLFLVAPGLMIIITGIPAGLTLIYWAGATVSKYTEEREKEEFQRKMKKGNLRDY